MKISPIRAYNLRAFKGAEDKVQPKQVQQQTQANTQEALKRADKAIIRIKALEQEALNDAKFSGVILREAQEYKRTMEQIAKDPTGIWNMQPYTIIIPEKFEDVEMYTTADMEGNVKQLTSILPDGSMRILRPKQFNPELSDAFYIDANGNPIYAAIGQKKDESKDGFEIKIHELYEYENGKLASFQKNTEIQQNQKSFEIRYDFADSQLKRIQKGYRSKTRKGKGEEITSENTDKIFLFDNNQLIMCSLKYMKNPLAEVFGENYFKRNSHECSYETEDVRMRFKDGKLSKYTKFSSPLRITPQYTLNFK